MTQAREARLNTVIKHSSLGEGCFIYDPDKGQQAFEPDSTDWFTWLAGRTSFHFKGKHGHFTARQEEKKKRDEQPSLWYWYAYRKAYGRQHKRYLGSTDALTLAKLEEMSAELQTAALGAYPTTRYSMLVFSAFSLHHKDSRSVHSHSYGMMRCSR